MWCRQRRGRSDRGDRRGKRASRSERRPRLLPLIGCEMSSTICCVDLTGLAMLELSAGGGSSRWVWQRNRISSSEARPASSSCDAARQQLEDAARHDFAAAGGGNCGTAADVWRTAFVRRRIALVVGGARRVLAGQLSPPELPDANAIQRKKDAPGDGEAARRFVAAQMAMQKVANRRARNRDRTLVASAAEVLSANGKVWAAPADSAFEYRMVGSTARPRHPRRRAVLDGLASESECLHAVGTAVLGMDPHRPDSDDVPSTFNGELSLVVSPPERTVRTSVGEGACRLVSLLLWRVQQALRTALEEDKPLYLAGAMLTQLQPPPTATARSGDRYEYSAPFVLV